MWTTFFIYKGVSKNFQRCSSYVCLEQLVPSSVHLAQSSSMIAFGHKELFCKSILVSPLFLRWLLWVNSVAEKYCLTQKKAHFSVTFSLTNLLLKLAEPNSKIFQTNFRAHQSLVFNHKYLNFSGDFICFTHFNTVQSEIYPLPSINCFWNERPLVHDCEVSPLHCSCKL